MNAETLVGNNRSTCCIISGICSGLSPGASCALGDISSSIIPNPSFEELIGCPFAPSQLDRAVTWTQATAGTSDYIVGAPACDDSWVRNGASVVTVTQNATDGVAFVGGIFSRFPNYAEYIGACLLESLEVGVNYTFNMDIAAGAADIFGVGVAEVFGGDTNGDTDMFCIPSCEAFQIFGFDYKGDDFEILATASPAGGLEGGGDWKSIIFEVTPTAPCPAIMFGPSNTQTIQPGLTGTYVIYDALNLQQGTSGVCTEDGECVEA